MCMWKWSWRRKWCHTMTWMYVPLVTWYKVVKIATQNTMQEKDENRKKYCFSFLSLSSVTFYVAKIHPSIVVSRFLCVCVLFFYSDAYKVTACICAKRFNVANCSLCCKITNPTSCGRSSNFTTDLFALKNRKLIRAVYTIHESQTNGIFHSVQ